MFNVAALGCSTTEGRQSTRLAARNALIATAAQTGAAAAGVAGTAAMAYFASGDVGSDEGSCSTDDMDNDKCSSFAVKYSSSTKKDAIVAHMRTGGFMGPALPKARQGKDRPQLSKIEDVYDRFEKLKDVSLDKRQLGQALRKPSRRRANGMGGFKADCEDGDGWLCVQLEKVDWAEALQYAQQRFSLMTAPELGRLYYQNMLKERRFDGWDDDASKRAPVYKFPKCAFGLSVTKIAERQEWLSRSQHAADRAVTARESIDNKAYLELVQESFENPAPGAAKKRKVHANMVPDGEVGTLTIYDRMGPWQCEFSSLRFSDWGRSVRANPAYKEGSTQENEKKKTITAGRVEPNSLPSCMLKYVEDPDTDAYATYRDLSSDERKSRVFQTLNNMKRKSDLGKPAAGRSMEGKVRKSSCEGAATMFNCGFTVDIGAITVMYRDLHQS